ncbi:MAG: DUF455 family protein, partial [Dokdonella sp.]
MHALDPFDLARECLGATDPATKVSLTRRHAASLRAGALQIEPGLTSAISRIVVGKPALPKLVEPRDLAHRGLGSVEGRAALIHAVAHIEFNAINLAWDAVLRFRDM